jgi:outer membrane protein assembly factor BamB
VDLAHVDGQLYGQPLVYGGRVYAATENDTVYALAADSGRSCGRTTWPPR